MTNGILFDQARHMYAYTVFYSKNTNIDISSSIVGQNQYRRNNKKKKK